MNDAAREMFQMFHDSREARKNAIEKFENGDVRDAVEAMERHYNLAAQIAAKQADLFRAKTQPETPEPRAD